jgi:glutamate/tyrosine decarboxylase-like PLP-dependent enzyme
VIRLLKSLQLIVDAYPTKLQEKLNIIFEDHETNSTNIHPPLIILILQAGDISTGAFDLYPECIEIVRTMAGRYCWIHVGGGAFGLCTRATQHYKHYTDGIELADSWVTNGHEWLSLLFDSCL